MQEQHASILVVDDDPIVRRMLVERLKQQGYQPAEAENGRQGLALVRSSPVDLILLDIMMPEMTGDEMLALLKQDAGLRHIPVIVISARNDMESIIKCIELGAEDYMVKPFRSLLLKARISACLDKKRLRDHEQIHIRKLKEANASKSQFVSIVSHELKTPMTAIKGYTDLLLSSAVGPVNEAQISFLQTIRSNTERMATLVSDLADISRMETGRLFLEFAPVNIADVVEATMHSTRRQIEAKNQSIHLNIPPDLPPVWADYNRVIQILTNLVSNANKYTAEKGKIILNAKETSGQYIHFSVQDTGVGITPDDQTKVFEQFFRSQDDAVREEPGHGLGLSITKNLVEAQGGDIWVESNYGKGSTFHVTLPVAN